MVADCIYDFPLHTFTLAAYYLGIIFLWLYKIFIHVTSDILMVFHFLHGLAVDKDGRSLLEIFKNPGMHTACSDLVDGNQTATWFIRRHVSIHTSKKRDEKSPPALPRIPAKYLVLSNCINFDGSAVHLGNLDIKFQEKYSPARNQNNQSYLVVQKKALPRRKTEQTQS
jgi:hypothetical protein